MGSQAMIMTHSPIRGKVGSELRKITDVPVVEISLHELTSSSDNEDIVKQVYASMGDEPRTAFVSSMPTPWRHPRA